jgi:hypothetical protein
VAAVLLWLWLWLWLLWLWLWLLWLWGRNLKFKLLKSFFFKHPSLHQPEPRIIPKTSSFLKC